MGKNRKVVFDDLEPEMEKTDEIPQDENVVKEDNSNEEPASDMDNTDAHISEEKPAFVPEAKEVTVKCARLNVRALPNKTSRVVTTLDNGTTVNVKTMEDPAWYEYTGFGFIMSEYVK